MLKIVMKHKTRNECLTLSNMEQRGGGRAGEQRVRKLAVKVFHPATKLATDRVDPEGLKPSR